MRGLMCCLSISSTCVDVGNLIPVKCSQALSNCIKKSSLFVSVSLACLLDVRICVYRSRGKSCLELIIKFIDTAQDLSREHYGGF